MQKTVIIYIFYVHFSRKFTTRFTHTASVIHCLWRINFVVCPTQVIIGFSDE